jgi:hypothetical protein
VFGSGLLGFSADLLGAATRCLREFVLRNVIGFSDVVFIVTLGHALQRENFIIDIFITIRSVAVQKYFISRCMN